MSDEEPESQKFISQKVHVSNQYRLIFVNAFELSISDNEVGIGVCVGGESLGRPGEPYREATLMMTHKSAKLLATLLQLAIGKFEDDNGPIPLSEERIQSIKNMIQAAKPVIINADK